MGRDVASMPQSFSACDTGNMSNMSSMSTVFCLLLLMAVSVLSMPVNQLTDNEEEPSMLPEILSGVPEHFNSQNEEPRGVSEYFNNPVGEKLEYNFVDGGQEHMGSHYQPKQSWPSMLGSGYGAFYRPGLAGAVGHRQAHQGLVHRRQHRQFGQHGQ